MDLDGYPLPVDALVLADADADGLGSAVIAVLLVNVLCLPIIVPPSAFKKHLCCLQCCESGSGWIHIKLKGGIRIKKISWLRTRIRTKVISRIQDPDPHQFSDDKA